MSGALLDDLLAAYVAPDRNAHGALAPAKAAKSANHEHTCEPALALMVCETLRTPANSADGQAIADSRNFAGVRNPEPVPRSEETWLPSQDSQDSQGPPAQCAEASDSHLSEVDWSNADIAGFSHRRARLLRWGWTEPEAEKLAARLVRRDREQDERVVCADCLHYRPSYCGNHRRAGLNGANVGRDFAALLQRCHAFE